MKRCLLIVCILIFSLLICGCTTSNQNVLPSNKFVAMTLIVRDSGEVVSDKTPMSMGAQPMPSFFDYPYGYNASNNPADSPLKNKSLKLFVGVINVNDDPAFNS